MTTSIEQTLQNIWEEIKDTLTLPTIDATDVADDTGPVSTAHIHIRGADGDDLLDGTLGDAIMNGGLGNDRYDVDSENDIVIEHANGGSDAIRSFVDFDLRKTPFVEDLMLMRGVQNGTGNDSKNVIYGNNGTNTLKSLGGNDILHGGDGKDVLEGGEGHDYLDGGFGLDFMSGSVGNDCYVVYNNNDVVIENANEGSDIIRTYVEDYDLSKTPFVEDLMLMTGIRRASGSEVKNVIYGNNLDNVIKGMGGGDILYGGDGKDILYGGLGDDTLDGGLGSDILWGSFQSSDVFRFSSALSPANVDRIADFQHGADKIWLDQRIFKKLGSVTKPSAMDAENFYILTDTSGPQDADDFLVYDVANNTLIYDADASGHDDGIVFARFGSLKPVLSSSDFMVF
jgi:Ca2+-binding RTX toxin-like protein